MNARATKSLLLSFLLMSSVVATPATQHENRASEFIAAAQSQIGVTLYYDGTYRQLSYPNGDVSMNTGVCTDVIIRAYRKLGIDLQTRVHEDMKQAFHAYPNMWGLTRPDANIDHRRVPNLQTFFKRHGHALKISQSANDYSPGDIVTWMLPGNLPHIGIVSAERNENGEPIIIHNIGRGTQKEAMFFSYPISGHYRFALR